MKSREPIEPGASHVERLLEDTAENQAVRGRLRLVGGRKERQPSSEGCKPRPFTLGVESDREARPFRIDAKARLQHILFSGQPGAGKSEGLGNMVRHDLDTGTGCCLIDPHGGLVNKVLSSPGLTAEQSDRIIVIDPADSQRPVGIDLLSARDEHEQDMVVQFFFALFLGMYLLDHMGPMLFQAVRNGLLLLMIAGRTLAEFPLLFSHPAYLKRLLERCTDPFVKRYFERIWNKTSDFHKSESLAYFTSKFSPFFEDRLMRIILAQRGGGLDFDTAMAEGKVVLVNLARGRIGDQNARLLGAILLHLLRRSAMRRDPSVPLRPFNLYVDEAHEFTGQELRELVTAMRKFGVGITLANQSIEDFDRRVRDTLLGSVGTFIILRQGLGTAGTLESLTQPRFDDRDLMRLPDFTAVVRTVSRERFVPPKRVRLAPPPRTRDAAQAAAIRCASAERYGRPRAEVEAELLRVVDGAEDSELPRDKSDEMRRAVNAAKIVFPGSKVVE
jgi:hypothetical protein